MSDKSFLSWPFFSDQCRAYSKELGSWCAANLNDFSESEDERADAKRLVGLLGEAGWFKAAVPQKFGGVDAFPSVRKLALTRETLGYYSGLADFVAAMQALGSMPITLLGTDDQKDRYLEKTARGELISTFALSESKAGSDAAAIETEAVADGGGFILNGEKTWISNAGIADYYVVFARTGEAPGAKGLSAFVVEADMPGFEFVSEIPITSPHPLGTIKFNDCRVPAINRIGEGGAGFKVAMATLDVMRSTVGAAALGFARRAFDEALRRVTGRELFGQPLSEFQLTQAKIADMATEIDASALLVYRAAWAKDAGAERITREASLAKLHATESAQQTIDKAVQLLGGLGVVRENTVERLYRDIRPLRIYEGTSEIQKIVIARQVLKEFAANQ